MNIVRQKTRFLVSKLFTGAVAATLIATTLTATSWPSTAAAVDATGVPPIVDNPANAVTADALPTAQINGVAWDQAIVGNTVYVGGEFTRARPAGSPAGSNESVRSNMLSYNLTTGVLNTGFAPVVNGPVRVVAASPDGTRIYIGGSFTSVNGQPRYRVAAFNTSDGSLVSSFQPIVSADVFGMVATNTTVYMGGWLGSVNGVVREKIAAVSAATGATLAWAPTADSTVRTMALNDAGDRLTIGGNFATINGSPAIGIASLDPSTGALYPFEANTIIKNYGNTAGTYSLKAQGDKVYGTGYWFGGTGNFEGVFVADAHSGKILNMLDCHGDTYDAVPMNGLIYNVSHHHHCTNAGGFPDTNPRTRYAYTSAFTDQITGVVQPNDQGGYASFAGQPAGSLVNWWPAMTTGTYTGQTQAAWTTEATDQYLVQGGEFLTVNGTSQQGLVRFAVRSIAPKKMGPAGAAIDAITTFRGVTDSSVRVTFMTNWDRDNLSLNYAVYRVGVTNPVYTTTASSLFWNRPYLHFTDTGLTPGVTYSYYVVATDADGNSYRSGYRTFTAGSEITDQTPYSDQVLADGATNYWRLDEAPGSTTSLDWMSGNHLVMGSTTALGAAGAIIGSFDTAADFNGNNNNSRSVSTNPIPGPQVFTAELWLKTTSTRGGKLLGFGNRATGNSTSYDRHIYMNNAGRLTFGVHPGTVRSLTSTTSYNDGQWHHVVASLSSAGMSLYVDGLLIGTDGGTTSSDAFQGYWRVGGDNMSGWPNIGSSNNFTGTIDDVAIYPTALTRAQIRDHYTKSGRTVNVPPAPSDAYGQAVYTDEPLLYWRLGETSGTTVNDQSGNNLGGTYSGGPLLNQPSTVTNNPSVFFDGTNDLASSVASFSNPTTYSIEAWFKSTSTVGGKIVGFGSSRTGLSSNYDRHVYLDPQGRINFGVYTGTTVIVTSTQSYNDGGWHHVVATQSSGGMQLIVDGVLLGTNPTTTAQNYTGYWRVGGDSSWSGNAWFRGNVDEVAIYSQPLTLQQARTHYRASGAATNQAPTAAFTASCVEGVCSVDATTSTDVDGTLAGYAWDFGDGATGSEATATHTYTTAGTHTITLTVTDDTGATDVTTRQVTTTAANQPPVAVITKSCTNLVCTFGSTGSNDPDGSISSYQWTFGDGSTGSGPSVTHTYTAGATYTVTLTVTDNEGKTGEATTTVSVQPANTAPQASFTVTKTNLVVSVDGSGSQDPDGTIADYHWDFGDGTTASGATATHAYAVAGDYTITLTVTDNRGGTDDTSESVTVAGVAVFASDEFNRSGSRWGNADVGGAWTDSGAAYYATNGSQGLITIPRGGSGPQAKLASVSALEVQVITDFTVEKLPVGGSYFHSLGIRDTGSQNYRGRVVVAPNGGVQVIVDKTAGGTVALRTVNVSGLVVQPNQKVNVEVTATGTTTTTLTVTVWIDGQPKPTTPQLSVDDTAGLTTPGAVFINSYLGSGVTNAPYVVAVDRYTVTGPGAAAPENQAPVAVITKSCTDLTCTFGSSGSNDPDGSISGYQWNFGDGTSASGANASRTYTSAGTYTVTLTVTDNGGKTGQATTTVQVQAGPNVDPVASFTVTKTNLVVSVDGSGSQDPDGTITDYHWDFGDGTTASGPTTTHAYAAPGDYTITLTVTDNRGGTDDTSESVTVAGAPVFASDEFNRSGSRWGNADVGGAWTDSGAAYYATNGSQGLITIPRGGSGPQAKLASVSALEVQVTTDFTVEKLPMGGSYFHSLGIRDTGSQNYRGRVLVAPNGGVQLIVDKTAGGSTVSLRTVNVSGLVVAPGQKVNVELTATGTTTTTLTLTVWIDGQPKPATAQLSVDDTAGLTAAGAVFINSYLGSGVTNAPYVVAVDRFTVTQG